MFSAIGRLCAALPLLFCLAPFIYAFAFCQPQADDFDFITRAMFLFDLPGAIYEAARQWVSWSGRYATHFFFVFFGAAPASQAATGILCLSLSLLWGIGGWLLARAIGFGRPVFFGLLCQIALFCSHSELWIFYLYTDALTAGLQGSLFLIFLAALCGFATVELPSRRRLAIPAIAGIIAIGVYENSALAVFLAACAALALNFDATRFRSIFTSQRLKACAALLAILSLALLFSWLAPGNMQRSEARAITSSLRLAQLAALPGAWLDTLAFFWKSPWPWTTGLLGALAALCPKTRKPARPLRVALCAAAIFLIYSLGMGGLLALSDTPLNGNAKQMGCISLYGGIAWGAIIFCLCAWAMGKYPRHFPRVLAPFCLAAFFASALLSPNFRAISVNAASGELLALDNFMDARKKALAALAAQTPEGQGWPPFGLKGEILTKSASRKPALRPDLPQASLDAWQRPVYPLYAREAHPPSPTCWPNLWAAWSYGIGSIRALAPAPDQAIARALEGKGLELPPQKPIAQGWLVDAPGNLGPVLSWLVLRMDKPPAKLWILRPNPLSQLRLAPVFCQKIWLENLLAQKKTAPTLEARLAASLVQFQKKQLKPKGQYLALPLGLASDGPGVVFISLDGKEFTRLAPFM